MYAVFATGGKQYRAAPGERIRVEKLDVAAGGTVELDQVLMIADGEDITVGDPLIAGGTVEATVVGHGRGAKIRVIKFRRRKNYRRQRGHRQSYTELEIVGVSTGGKPKAKKAAPAEKPAPAKKAEAKPAKAKKAGAKKPTKAEPAAVKFLDAPEGTADDLKKISGVGPVLEKKLNKLGIYHYRQIAAFTPEQIVEVDDALSFKGRIERDNWVEQAKTLAAESEQNESKE